MPRNNNQKVQTAAARLAKLPVVRAACTKLTVLYIDTKCSHPGIRSVCEVLENSVAALGTVACDRVSPVIVKLGPQISLANVVACKGLDWLETTFPVLQEPTEQIVAEVKNKMHEIQDVVSITAHGTLGCVEHTVMCVKAKIQQGNDQANRSLVERAITVATVGLDTALEMSEALVDRMLPPTKEEKEEAARFMEGFEAAIWTRSYPERLITLSIKLCRRTYQLAGSKMRSVEAMETLCRSSGLLPDLRTRLLDVVSSLQELPHYLQHQLVCVLFFISQMSNLNYHSSQQTQSITARSAFSAMQDFPAHHVVKTPPLVPPKWHMRRPRKTFDRQWVTC